MRASVACMTAPVGVAGQPGREPRVTPARLGGWAGRERMHLYYHMGEDGKRVYTLKKKDPEGKVRLWASRALCVRVSKGEARLPLLASVRAVSALATRCGARCGAPCQPPLPPAD